MNEYVRHGVVITEDDDYLMGQEVTAVAADVLILIKAAVRMRGRR